jgi:hypothetical protein
VVERQSGRATERGVFGGKPVGHVPHSKST